MQNRPAPGPAVFLLRQRMGFIQSLLKQAGVGWRIPDFSTLSRRQLTLQVKTPWQKSSDALHLLVASTGIKMLGEGAWKTKKHDAAYRPGNGARHPWASMRKPCKSSALSLTHPRFRSSLHGCRHGIPCLPLQSRLRPASALAPVRGIYPRSMKMLDFYRNEDQVSCYETDPLR